jgi:hypothetical protein
LLYGAGDLKMNDFEKCVKRKALDYTYKIDCALGLWGVEGDSKTLVESEAFHYWQQYNKDGEYYKILGGQSPA